MNFSSTGVSSTGVFLLLGVIFYPIQATICRSRAVKLHVNSTKYLFNSPGFPNNYARPLACTWLFITGSEEVINFRIMTFDVFPSIFCYRDIFDIYDGKVSYSPVMQSWCGSRPSGQQYQTSGRYSLVTFQAVTVGEPRQGFEFEVWSETKHSPETGEAEMTPLNLVMLGVFAFFVLLFFVLITVLIYKDVQTTKEKEEDDEA